MASEYHDGRLSMPKTIERTRLDAAPQLDCLSRFCPHLPCTALAITNIMLSSCKTIRIIHRDASRKGKPLQAGLPLPASAAAADSQSNSVQTPNAPSCNSGRQGSVFII